MAERATPQRLMSVEEYLEFEQESPIKHEYVGGHVYAMVGVSSRHSRIALNTARKLADAAEGGPCRVHQSNMKVPAEDAYYYPDVVVACAPEPEDPYVENEPCLVVEVVSPSSEATDRREKLLAYQNIPSVGAYLIVGQDRRRVERHFRGEDGEWRKADLVDEGHLPVSCPPGAQLSLAEVYEGL